MLYYIHTKNQFNKSHKLKHTQFNQKKTIPINQIKKRIHNLKN